jgi:cytosine/adenosine deaminase-related metal-dependent hydrolase
MQKLNQNKPISIHNQESEGEMEMFERKSGSLKEMLMNFGNVENEIDKEVSSSLAHALQFIDPNQKLLLVHNTFTNTDDIDKAEESHSNLYWCFCPNANWYIEKRLPNIPLFLQKGVKCTLGTDSLASNHDLSILSEMKLIQTHYPEISTETMIEWATRNGAEFLELTELGAFEVGKKVGLNHISNLSKDGKLTKLSRVKAIY